MRKLTPEEKKARFDLVARHIEKQYMLIIIVLSLIVFASAAFIVFWFYDPTTYTEVVDNIYLISQFVHLTFVSAVLLCVILNHHKKINTRSIVILFHCYALFTMTWATFLCICDLSVGLSPIIYLLIATAVAGLLIIEPFYFLIVAVSSFTAIVIAQLINNYPFYNGINYAENAANTILFFGLIILIAFRRFKVIMAMERATLKLEQLAHYDELTDLLNERSYIKETECINQRIKEGKHSDFAVVLMDVNNLKVTNDAYGHRYGCHLIVRCGHVLPTIFKTSKLFHVGGDEFIAIVYGEDFEHFEERIKTFDEQLRYSKIEYEGQELIFSVARGYAIHQEGQEFKDVLQIADDAMYENKAEIKKTYHMKSRR